jgi:hypothetical protein
VWPEAHVSLTVPIHPLVMILKARNVTQKYMSYLMEEEKDASYQQLSWCMKNNVFPDMMDIYKTANAALGESSLLEEAQERH